jgi:23S rRNA (cytosine1962-C5)-methyltransferase
MYTVVLKPNEEKRILGGHPWVFANEVSRIEGKDVQGSVARVTAFDGRFVGCGFINHASKILVRMLALSEVTCDRDFLFSRISAAANERKNLGYEDNFRAVFSESDGLSGLIVDKYGDVLSVQILSLGMEVRKDMIVDVLREVFNPVCIFERSDVSIRQKEGLSERKGVLFGELPSEVIITENGVRLAIDVAEGQKTGYFLDQKENRDNIKHFSKGKSVLDLFCNQGGFSLVAAKNGAKSVQAVDISERALEAVKHNAELNGCEIETVQADVFELLRTYKREGKQFDLIILDPPAFTKSKDTVKEGLNGYRDINTLAMRLLAPNGVLVTCSCSQHVTLPLFTGMLTDSSIRAKVRMKLAELRIQAKDHASFITEEEAVYLKCAVLLRAD